MFLSCQSNKAVELGRIGGKKNGHLQVGLDLPPRLDNAMAIRDTLARQIANVYAGKLHPRICGGTGPSGDRLRITAQLIDPINESHLWAESYDRILA